MKITNLQGLRAFAALNVVLFHIIGTSDGYGYGTNWISFLKGWGGSGVDIFFVISGFIMVYTQRIRRKSPFIFILNRIIRIAPIYWILTFLLIFLMFILPNAFNSSSINLNSTILSLLFLSLSIDATNPILFVGWTLEYEMLFYVIFSFTLFSKQKNIQLITLPVLIFGIAIFLPVKPIIIEFIFGVLIAHIILDIKFTKYSVQLFAVGSILLTLSLFIETDISRVILWGIPSALIVFASCNLPQTQNKLLIHLGNSSYSIYLIQVFTIPFFYKACELLSPSFSTDILALLCLTFTAFVGSLTYILCEKPIHVFLRRLNKN